MRAALQHRIYLVKARTDFIPHSLWLLNSPDLNPGDYAVWAILKAHLQESDQGRGRAAPARQGGVRQY